MPLSERRLRFQRDVAFVWRQGLTLAALAGVARERGVHPIFRLAALHVLVFRAPVDVTVGRPCVQRRRLVRHHFAV